MFSQPDATGLVGTGLRAALRSRSRVARSARAIVRWSAVTAGLALGLFHLFLFWDRLIGGDLFDPAIALRWLAAAGLAAALVALRRMGFPLTKGRQACVVWLLVVLLHASSQSVPAVPDEMMGLDAGVVFVLPTTLTLAGLGLLCVTAVRRQLTVFAPIGRVVTLAVPGYSSTGWRRNGTTRGPPLAAI